MVRELGADDINFGPGAEPADALTRQRLSLALHRKGADYQPRTRHLQDDGTPQYTNRLLLEASPYLQQHAHNPVNWHPWGEKAFALAAELRRPVLLSVGYATCHWCHVMEEESFEDEAIARYLNENYVAIKVDREERPDIDNVYMSCVTAWSGQGGWPMTVWLTPSREPFFGGTYFPPVTGARGARAGFRDLLEDLKQVFDKQPERVALAAEQVIAHIRSRHDVPVSDSGITDEFLQTSMAAAYRYYDRLFDPQWGGLDGAPKFPSSLPLRFLLRHALRAGGHAQEQAFYTLRKVAAGGIHDQIGGGFHRYSVDDEWLVPHFEKMLYDNALLTVAYIEAWQAGGGDDFAVVARSTLDYVRRELVSVDGGFYAATDADSPNPEREGEREEGWFFTWTPEELRTVLGDDQARIVAAYYDVRAGGNFEGRTVMHVPRPFAEVATALGMSEGQVSSAVERARPLLYAARAKRPAPLTDDKVITAWHALMTSAFAKASLAFGSEDYLQVAQHAAAFMQSKLWVAERLVRCYKDGPSNTAGFLEDYAFAIQALLDLYEASLEPRWLEWSVTLTASCEQLFAAPDGGYYLTAHDAEQLFYRERPSYDGATPAGTSVHAMNLLRLASLCDDASYRRRAMGIFAAARPTLERSPSLLGEMLIAADFALSEPRQILFVGREATELQGYLSAVGRRFLPHRVIAGGVSSAVERASALVPLLRHKGLETAGATAYICRGQVCGLPVSDLVSFESQLA